MASMIFLVKFLNSAVGSIGVLICTGVRGAEEGR